MKRVIASDDRRLLEAEQVTAVCRGCSSRMAFGAETLAVLDKAGIETVGTFRRWAYCQPCEHAGYECQELRIQVDWRELPANVVRLFPVVKRAA